MYIVHLYICLGVVWQIYAGGREGGRDRANYITICYWTDIMSHKSKFITCMVGHNAKVIRHDLTFTNVDLTNVRCQTVITGRGDLERERWREEEGEGEEGKREGGEDGRYREGCLDKTLQEGGVQNRVSELVGHFVMSVYLYI